MCLKKWPEPERQLSGWHWEKRTSKRGANKVGIDPLHHSERSRAMATGH